MKIIDKISISDRGLNYGDGIFETIAIKNSTPIFWNQHLTRLAKGCTKLKILVPDFSMLATETKQLITEAQGVLKIIVTRGSGGRGYKPLLTPQENHILNFFPWPDNIKENATNGIRVHLCQTALASQPILAGIKHLNRLEQVLASMEWDDPEFAEGLMFDYNGHLIEGTKTNVFLVKNNVLSTPGLSEAGIEGIIRQQLFIIAKEAKIECKITQLTKQDLLNADEVFVCNSIIGIWPVLNWNHRKMWPMTQLLQKAVESKSQPAWR